MTNLADYDWLLAFTQSCTGECEETDCNCSDNQLHAPANSADWDDWDGDPHEDGQTACGITATLAIPGVGSRMCLPRCPSCCDKLGYPHGDGSPKNDSRCVGVDGPRRLLHAANPIFKDIPPFKPMVFRIYYIHQVPGKPFVMNVDSPEIGHAILDAIYKLMLLLVDTNHIPDYANTGGVECLDEDGEWVEYEAEDWDF